MLDVFVLLFVCVRAAIQTAQLQSFASLASMVATSQDPVRHSAGNWTELLQMTNQNDSRVATGTAQYPSDIVYNNITTTRHRVS